MTPKNYLKIFFIALITSISLISIGGYGGHHLKFLAATIIYFGLTIFFLPKTKTTKEVLLVVFLIDLPPSLFYIPIRLKNFKETQIDFLSNLGHFVGIVFGIITHFVSGKMKIVLFALLLIS